MAEKRRIVIEENDAGGFQLTPEPANKWPINEVTGALYACLGRVLAIIIPLEKKDPKKVKKFTSIPPKPAGNGGGA